VTTQINKEQIKKQMNKLEVFLKTIGAKYTREENSVEIYGNVYETIFNYLREFEEVMPKIKIEIEEGKLLEININKNSINLEAWSNYNLRIEIIDKINDIIVLKDTVYIFF
jgi:hypothetical protein